MSRAKKNTSPSGQAQRGEEARRAKTSDQSQTTTGKTVGDPLVVTSDVSMALFALSTLRGEDGTDPVFDRGTIFVKERGGWVGLSKEDVILLSIVPFDGIRPTNTKKPLTLTRRRINDIYETMCLLASANSGWAPSIPPGVTQVSVEDRKDAARRWLRRFTQPLAPHTPRTRWTRISELHQDYLAWLHTLGASQLGLGVRWFGRVLKAEGIQAAAGAKGARCAPLRLLPGATGHEGEE